MPRPYHSPSSISLGLTCKHAWALSYVDGIRDPNLEWDDRYLDLKWDFGANCFVMPVTGERVTAAQRGSALGGGLHLTAERWYDPTRGKPDWNWFPGQVLASGKHLLPEPSKIERVIIEQAIGTIPLPKRARRHERDPDVAIEVGGILWAGFVDNEAHGGDELKRLGIVAPDGVATIDYKTSSNLEKYGLTRAELLKDPQAALYAINGCRKLGLQAMPERWVYFETKKKRRAIAVDVNAELSRALDVIGPCADLARELDMITNSADAPKNSRPIQTELGPVAACNMYGPPDRINCRHHKVNGGSCNAWAPFRALTQLSKKPEIKEAMADITAEERKAAFEKKKAEMAAKKAAAGSAAPAPEPDASEPEAEGATEPEPTETPAPKTTTTAAAPKPKASTTKPAEGSQAATISALALELAAADKARDAVLAKLRAAVA